jgi:hypothetical protein
MSFARRAPDDLHVYHELSLTDEARRHALEANIYAMAAVKHNPHHADAQQALKVAKNLAQMSVQNNEHVQIMATLRDDIKYVRLTTPRQGQTVVTRTSLVRQARSLARTIINTAKSIRQPDPQTMNDLISAQHLLTELSQRQDIQEVIAELDILLHRVKHASTLSKRGPLRPSNAHNRGRRPSDSPAAH